MTLPGFFKVEMIMYMYAYMGNFAIICMDIHCIKMYILLLGI